MGGEWDFSAYEIACFTCFLVVGTLLTGYAWVGLYQLWNRHFYHKPISNIYQIAKLVGWIFLVVATIFISIVMLWVFRHVLSETLH
jgi:hypothetical protein